MAREIEFLFPLATGLHARPAALLQARVGSFRCEAALVNRRTGVRCDARSVLSLLTSGTRLGDRCALLLDGPEEEPAARFLRRFLEEEFAASEAPAAEAAAVEGAAALPPSPAGRAVPTALRLAGARCLQGVPASPGVGLGETVAVEAAVAIPEAWRTPASDPDRERRLVARGVERLSADLDERIARATNPAERDILAVHRAIARDPAFEEIIRRRIVEEGKQAAVAIQEGAEEFAGLLSASASRYLAERAADIHDVAARLTRAAYGEALAETPPPLRERSVVVARRLLPSTFLGLDRRKVAALLLLDETPTSHTLILARSFGLPCVTGVQGIGAAPGGGTPLIVDGSRGIVVIDPPPGANAFYEIDRDLRERLSRRCRAAERREGATRDGRRVEVGANVATLQEVEAAIENGADRIGLFRTEFLFLGRGEPPGEEEQASIYSSAARLAGGRPVVVRLLDIGGDKPWPFLRLPPEPNPFLGRRAVRLYPDAAGIVRAQIRAVLRAAATGDLRILIPMVTRASEIALVRKMVREAAGALAAERIPHRAEIPIGAMVEVPAAALAIDRLSEAADFLSVGTNDLAQYLMAADRSNPATATLADPLEPPFLWILRKIADDARRNGRHLGICGEMAGDPRYLPILVGLGFDDLGVPPASIPAVKAALGTLHAGECRALLDAALGEPDAAAVERLLLAARTAGEPMPLIEEDLVALDLACAGKALALHRLVCLLDGAGRAADPDALEEALWRREEAGPTSIGLGIAIPHCKSAAVRQTSIAVLRPAAPVPWDDPAGEPARLILLLAVREGDPEGAHLALLAQLSRRLVDEQFREALLAAASPADVVRILAAGPATP